MKGGRREVQLMPFASIRSSAPSPDAWLVHPLLWLQPELTLIPPGPTPLRIERRHEVPVPTFVPLLVKWGIPQGQRATPTVRVAAGSLSRPPATDLIPLGWDPRALK